MEKIKILMGDRIEIVNPKHIVEIQNGKALLKTKRWYSIICDCLNFKDYETVPDSEAPGGNGYIICDHCNRVHYLKDLRDMQP